MPVDRKFVEPVVMGERPFEIIAEVARETAARTHELVMRLTSKRVDPDTTVGRSPPEQPAAHSR
ncbi:hypothetical protein D7Y27_12485 [Corallococcus sp. AB004]|nr:hypothetical protein D7Y27_12485 [Corallococcus sp. AB004]